VFWKRQEIAGGALERCRQSDRKTRKEKKPKLEAARLHGKTTIYNLSQAARASIVATDSSLEVYPC
jgi:hypothetical protein